MKKHISFDQKLSRSALAFLFLLFFGGGGGSSSPVMMFTVGGKRESSNFEEEVRIAIWNLRSTLLLPNWLNLIRLKQTGLFTLFFNMTRANFLKICFTFSFGRQQRWLVRVIQELLLVWVHHCCTSSCSLSCSFNWIISNWIKSNQIEFTTVLPAPPCHVHQIAIAICTTTVRHRHKNMHPLSNPPEKLCTISFFQVGH